jgi:hypothetical protein
LFLIAIAVFYLACMSYFGDAAAWSLETVAVLAFTVMGCLGTRVPVVLIAGYALHGGWDLLHEVYAHMQADVFGGREATKIPLAYGAFCATFDWAMVVCCVSAPPLGRCLRRTLASLSAVFCGRGLAAAKGEDGEPLF